MSEETELPVGWVHTVLEQIVVIRDDLRKPVNADERAKRIGPYPYYGATGQVGCIDGYLMDGEYILLEEDGAPFLDPFKAKAYMVSGKCWVNNHAHVLHEIKGLSNNRFIMHMLNAYDYRKVVNGTTRLKLIQAAMKQITVQLPPLPEQDRIVQAIEQHFSRLDAGVAALKRAKAKLKRYRAAVLKAAVEGKLTENWRAEHSKTEPASLLLERILKERRAKWEDDLRAKGKDPTKVKYVEPVAADVESLPELPEGWCWATVEQTSGSIKDCLHSTPNFQESGFVCIDTNCIKPGRILYEKVRNVDEATFIDRNRRMKPQENDVIFSREGALLGVAVRVPADLEFCLGQRMMIFRLNKGIDAKYFEIVLNSSVFRDQYLKEISGTASPHLNIQDIRTFSISLPPLIEQLAIVTEFESVMSTVEELEMVIIANLKRAERLRQSILQEAFAGRLVPQDPTDELASVLLERIRNERNGQNNGMGMNGKKSRAVRVPEPVTLDTVEAEQTELWESVGNEGINRKEIFFT